MRAPRTWKPIWAYLLHLLVMGSVLYLVLSFVFLIFPITYDTAFTPSVLILALVLASVQAAFTWGFIRRRFIVPMHETKEYLHRLTSSETGNFSSMDSSRVHSFLQPSLEGLAHFLDEERRTFSRMEKVRSEFLGNVSHELRTPLFTLQGYLETLLDGAINDSRVNHTFLEKALSQTSRLNELVSDLIDISRIESGDLRLSPRYFDLREFLLNVVDQVRDYATQKGVTLDTLAIGEESVTILADRTRLGQVVSNLLENAIKYNREKGRVEVALHVQKGEVILSIRDTGIGISKEHQERIFERFYRVDKGRSREVGGTGLGLAIVKHIVHAHRGHIELDSQPGEGSLFRIFLPR